MALTGRHYVHDLFVRPQATRDRAMVVIAVALAAVLLLLLTSSRALSAPGQPDIFEIPLICFSPSLSSPVQADSSLPLLISIRHAPDAAADRNQRPAGDKAAGISAFGYILGARYALGPVERFADSKPKEKTAP
ncbi:MAG: hypothetical protein IT558_02235 [Alphaproteobacteria bacterium]|nr:hypothetical protein [Alphaproteobacteria bacterium]